MTTATCPPTRRNPAFAGSFEPFSFLSSPSPPPFFFFFVFFFIILSSQQAHFHLVFQPHLLLLLLPHFIFVGIFCVAHYIFRGKQKRNNRLQSPPWKSDQKEKKNPTSRPITLPGPRVIPCKFFLLFLNPPMIALTPCPPSFFILDF